MLRAALEQALSRRGRGVMIAGEPGIGKTRTAQEFSEYAAQKGATVLWGRCHEEAGAPPYWPWVQIIRSLLQSRAPEAPLGDLGPGAGDIADLAPEMRDRLRGSGSGARLKDTAEARFRMFEAIRRLLAGACEHQALVVVLDDLHWADAPSLRLLEFLAPEIADIPLLLVGTYRATELSRQHPLSNTLGGLARRPHCPGRFARPERGRGARLYHRCHWNQAAGVVHPVAASADGRQPLVSAGNRAIS